MSVKALSTRTYSRNNYASRNFRFRYFIVDIVTRRSAGGSIVQASEFNFLNGSTRITGGTWAWWNNAFTGNSSSNTTYGTAGEGPDKANDGSVDTKWLDTRVDSSAGLWVDFGSNQLANGYRWYTANDSTERDPASWRIYGSVNNTSWTLLSEISDFSATTTRQALAGTWTFNV